MRRYLNRVTNQPLAILLIAVGMTVPTAVLAAADTFMLTPDVQLVGQVATVAAAHDDTLTDIARVYGLGYEEIVWARELQ
jgi:hypothetical protein